MLVSYVALSFALIGFYRWFARHYHWLDHPNHRSSHTATTPRGAGLIFSFIILSSAAWQLRHEWSIFLPLLTGLVVALVGWIDDVRDLSAGIRFSLYTFSSATSVALVFMWPADSSVNFLSVFFCAAIATLGITWLINLYNFMDGINGLAALEAVFVLLSINFFAHDTYYAQIFTEVHLFSCAALIGFLIWNFPAGKVFMGDAGSAFLGFFLGALILLSFKMQGPAPTVWFILLAIFIVDTSYTLLIRITTKQKWYEAHRLHAYQLLTRRLHGSHSYCVITLMLTNLFWLLPIAWCVQAHVLNPIYGLMLAYLPLLIACHWLKAGAPQSSAV